MNNLKWYKWNHGNIDKDYMTYYQSAGETMIELNDEIIRVYQRVYGDGKYLPNETDGVAKSTFYQESIEVSIQEVKDFLAKYHKLLKNTNIEINYECY